MAVTEKIIEFIKGLRTGLNRGQKPKPPRGEAAPRRDDIYDQLDSYVGKIPRIDPVTDGQASKVGQHYKHPYGEYDEIIDKDPMISAVLTQRISAVLNRDRVWKAANDTDGAQKAKALMEEVARRLDLNGMDGGFQKDLFDLMQGVPRGLSIMEIVWGTQRFPIYDADGKKKLAEEEWYIPLRLEARDPRRFGWDKYDRLRVMTPQNSLDGELAHPLKYIVFRPYNRYENPYGTPLLRSVWWAAWFKKQMFVWWAKRNERIGDPTVWAMPKDREHSWTDEQETAVYNSLDNMQTQTAMTLPPGSTIGTIEMALDAGFETFIKYVDDQISMAIIGQTMTTDTGEKGGSKGLSEVHERVAHSVQAMDARMLESIINSTFVAWTVMLNLGDVPLPQLEIVTEPPKNLLEMAEWIEKLAQFEGVAIPARWVHEAFGVDKAQSESETVKPRQEPQQMALPGQQPSQNRSTKRRAKQNERRRKKPGDEPRPRPSKP